MGRRLDELQLEFQSKLKYDAHKEQIIDQLHRELQGYRNDLIKKPLNTVIMDIIKVADDVRRLTAHYRQRTLAPGDPQKVLEILEEIPTELEEIFFRQGVQPFALAAEAFDPARQQVLKKIETDDQSKARQVAASLRPGYEWEGRVIRREMVAVYDYQAPQTDSEVRSSDA
jgi:molecular chaperone GrpE (heat shock protein)